MSTFDDASEGEEVDDQSPGREKRRRKFKSIASSKWVSSVGCDSKKINECFPDEQRSSESASPSRELLDAIDREAHGKVLQGLWKTTKTSNLCVVIIRLKSQHNTDAGAWSPSILSQVLCRYPRVRSFSDPLLYKGYTNMRTGRASDPQNSNKNTPLLAKYKKMKGKRKAMIFDVYRCYTFISIPYERLKSEEEERAWCNNAVGKLLASVKRTTQEETFTKTVKDIRKKRSQMEGYEEDEIDKDSSLEAFMKETTVQPTQIDRLNEHVVQSVANDIMTRLFQHNCTRVKYENSNSNTTNHQTKT